MPPVVYPDSSIDMGYLVAADFDRDGYTDIAMGASPGHITATVLFNDGHGEFTDQLDMNFQQEVYFMYAADFNGDGSSDLAMRCSDGQFVILSNGDRTFQNHRRIDMVMRDVFTGVADMDNDGDVDIISRTFDDIVIFKNDGNASFEPTVGYGFPHDCMGTTTGDFDNDGDQDLVVLESDDDYITIFLNRTFETNTIQEPSDLPNKTSLIKNYPNPFNGQTTIKYSIQQCSDVLIDIYDILGRKIDTCFLKRQQAGSHSFNWNAGNLSSGIYFVKLQSNGHSKTAKMILLK